MIRFKQRMSLCSEVSIASSSDDDGTASAAAASAAAHQAQKKDSRRHHSPPPVPAVSVNINLNLGRVDSSSAALHHLPPSSDSSLASSSCLGDRTVTTTATAALPMSHVEIHRTETKIHIDANGSGSSSSTPPPAAVTAVAKFVVSPSHYHNGPVSGKKRTVSDATDEDSSVPQVHSGNSPITTTTITKSSKRPRTLLPPSAPDSADSPPSSSTQLRPPRLHLLACPADPHHLNPLHCFVRRQIEVFAATPQDASAPCQGRKVRIRPGQVGLRCVHCKRAEVESTTKAAHGTKQKPPKRPKRIKRAVCYPSKVSRVYNSVSDMKFDHFGVCPHMPLELQNELALLKALHGGGANGNTASSGGGGGGKKRGGGTASTDVSVASQSSVSVSTMGASSSASSTSSSSASTARYYHETAQLIGLVDAPSEGTVGGGIRFGFPPAPKPNELRLSSQTPPLPLTVDVVAPKKPKRRKTAAAITKAVAKTTRPAQHVVPIQTCVPIAAKIPTFPRQVTHPPLPLPSPIDANTTTTTTTTNNNKTFLLAASEDVQILNPIHCFVRRNVEVFAATAADVAAPAPGRKNRLVVGQVGIRCVHCVHLPPRDRVKRSSCYPPNVSGIYHAVSNMKFDHFASCKGLDAETRAEFQALRAACGRKGGGRAAKSSTSSSGSSAAAARGTMSSSTAQYYHDSAQNLGLVDTSDGIRFLPEEAAKLRAAAAMVIQAHQGPSPPPMAAATTKVQIPITTSATLPPLDNGARSAISVTPDHSKYPSALPNFSLREPIPDGLSALMMAASQRSAEYAPQMGTAKLAV